MSRISEAAYGHASNGCEGRRMRTTSEAAYECTSNGYERRQMSRTSEAAYTYGHGLEQVREAACGHDLGGGI
jgi:hypothetical protein